MLRESQEGKGKEKVSDESVMSPQPLRHDRILLATASLLMARANAENLRHLSILHYQSAMDLDVSSQEGTLVEAQDKPFRHTKPEAVVSKLYSYQLESLTWMTVRTLSPLRCGHCRTDVLTRP
jgi:hypothetical protein